MDFFLCMNGMFSIAECLVARVLSIVLCEDGGDHLIIYWPTYPILLVIKFQRCCHIVGSLKWQSFCDQWRGNGIHH